MPQPGSAADTLSLISFNIQVGIQTSAWHHYLTRSWQHILPHRERNQNLERIADIIRHFDIAGVQEADGGSLRSHYVNQVEHLAELADFPHWFHQINRNMRPMARHSNGLLSHLAPDQVEYHKLPGLLPGRGAIVMKTRHAEPICIIMLHLALGAKTQYHQLGYITHLLKDVKHVIIMGDLNNQADHLLTHTPLANLRLQSADPLLHTFPSWSPGKGLDHILVSEDLKILKTAVLDAPISDHLPIAMQIALPPSCLSTQTS